MFVGKTWQLLQIDHAQAWSSELAQPLVLKIFLSLEDATSLWKIPPQLCTRYVSIFRPFYTPIVVSRRFNILYSAGIRQLECKTWQGRQSKKGLELAWNIVRWFTDHDNHSCCIGLASAITSKGINDLFLIMVDNDSDILMVNLGRCRTSYTFFIVMGVEPPI